MRITISISDDVLQKIDDYRKEQFPHLQTISRMMLQIVMDKMKEDKRVPVPYAALAVDTLRGSILDKEADRK